MTAAIIFFAVLCFACELTIAIVVAASHRSRAKERSVAGDHRVVRTTRDGLRASDADRDRAVTAIQFAMGEGRLGIDEGIRRIEDALSSRFADGLDALLADLPPTTQTPDRRQGSMG